MPPVPVAIVIAAWQASNGRHAAVGVVPIEPSLRALVRWPNDRVEVSRID
jgi:hypothetical protein